MIVSCAGRVGVGGGRDSSIQRQDCQKFRFIDSFDHAYRRSCNKYERIPYLCPSQAAWILFLNCTPLHPAYEVCTPLLMIQGHDSNTAYCRGLLQKVRYIRLPIFAPNDLRLYGLK